MIELSISEIAIAVLSGAISGVIFFGGLKFTVDRITTTANPTLVLLGSLIMRFTVVLGGAYWIITLIHWQALLIALMAFIYVRLILTRLVVNGPSNEH